MRRLATFTIVMALVGLPDALLSPSDLGGEAWADGNCDTAKAALAAAEANVRALEESIQQAELKDVDPEVIAGMESALSDANDAVVKLEAEVEAMCYGPAPSPGRRSTPSTPPQTPSTPPCIDPTGWNSGCSPCPSGHVMASGVCTESFETCVNNCKWNRRMAGFIVTEVTIIGGVASRVVGTILGASNLIELPSCESVCQGSPQ